MKTVRRGLLRVVGLLGVLLVGVVIGVLAGAELGRHDDASLA